jgi:hypothetical protein
MDMKLIKLCKHQIIWDEINKTMVFPITKYGYCIICGSSCKKVGGKIIWED